MGLDFEDLAKIANSDQLKAGLKTSAEILATFYVNLIEEGLPKALASELTVEFARVMLMASAAERMQDRLMQQGGLDLEGL